MKKLLLFDIDGTLVTGPHTDRFTTAINNVHDLNLKSDKDFNGYTDYLILVDLLENEGWTVEQIQSAMPRLMEEIDLVHKESFSVDYIELLPGVEKLLNALDKKAVLGLITGNLQTIAERKLTALGVWHYFVVGGFGSDPHSTRADLVKIAIKRAKYQKNMDEVYVIGDTPRDIIAATDAGIKNSVGVANGYRDTRELKDAGARIVFEDFIDTNLVLDKLRVK